MKNEKIKKIDQFSAHMDEMDNRFFEGEIPAVSLFLVYGGRRIKLTFCPEVTEKIREAIAAEKEYWEED